MDNLKISVVFTTSEMPVLTEPPGAVESCSINLFSKKLAHIVNFLRQNYWYDLHRIYDSELKLHMMRKYQLE